MVLLGIAIDAGWLRSLDEAENDLFERIDFLNSLNIVEVPLLLDSQGLIMREYTRNLLAHSIGRKFVSRRLTLGPVEYLDGRPTKQCRSALQKTSFDSDDLPYVGVAQRCGAAAYLTHETKHHRQAVRELLLSIASVHVGDFEDLRPLLLR